MPVRKIALGRRSLTGRLAGPAGTAAITFESSLERDFATLSLFNPDVASVEEQPVRIEYVEGATRRRYTPDFLVRYHDSARPALLAEIKFQAELEANRKHMAARFAAAGEFAVQKGWLFEVVTEREIRTPCLENARFLLPYRHRPVDAGRCARLSRCLAALGSSSIDGLLNEAWTDEKERLIGLTALWRMVADFRFLTNLDQPLSKDSVLHLADQGVPCQPV